MSGYDSNGDLHVRDGKYKTKPQGEENGVQLSDPVAFSAGAVAAAVAEAKRIGKPVLIEHPSGNRLDLDEHRFGSMAGDRVNR